MSRTVYRLAIATTIGLIATLPASAETAGTTATGTTAAAPQDGAHGNGVTTSPTSAPEMKTGAERSPTAGAPTGGTTVPSGSGSQPR